MGKLVKKRTVRYDLEILKRLKKDTSFQYVRFIPNTLPQVSRKYGKIIAKGFGKERYIEFVDEELKDWVYRTEIQDYHLIETGSKEWFVLRMKLGDV